MKFLQKVKIKSTSPWTQSHIISESSSFTYKENKCIKIGHREVIDEEIVVIRNEYYKSIIEKVKFLPQYEYKLLLLLNLWKMKTLTFMKSYLIIIFKLLFYFNYKRWLDYITYQIIEEISRICPNPIYYIWVFTFDWINVSLFWCDS